MLEGMVWAIAKGCSCCRQVFDRPKQGKMSAVRRSLFLLPNVFPFWWKKWLSWFSCFLFCYDRQCEAWTAMLWYRAVSRLFLVNGWGSMICGLLLRSCLLFKTEFVILQMPNERIHTFAVGQLLAVFSMPEKCVWYHLLFFFYCLQWPKWLFSMNEFGLCDGCK